MLYSRNGIIKDSSLITIEKDGKVIHNPSKSLLESEGWVEFSGNFSQFINKRFIKTTSDVLESFDKEELVDTIVFLTDNNKLYLNGQYFGGEDASNDYSAGSNISIENNIINAEGYTYDSAIYSIAEGKSGATASGTGSHAEGNLTTASGDYSHAEGVSSESSGHNSHAEGNGSKSIGRNSHAEGTRTVANNNQSHTEGYETQANANGAHAEGDSTIAYGCYSHVEGANSITGYTGETPTKNTLKSPSNTNDSIGGYAHAEGSATLAIGKASHAEGDKTFAAGDYSHAEGTNSESLGHNSHAEGNGSKSIGQNSHAEGTRTVANNNQSHTEGFETKAMANGAHAEGDSTIAYGCYSHVEGANCVTGYQGTEPFSNNLTAPSNTNDGVGGYAHAEGAATLAIGKASHAEGIRTFASGAYSHVEGEYTQATGEGSHAEGIHNVAVNHAQHVCGKYAIPDTTGKAIMQVGVGVGSNDDQRQDGFVVYTDGTFKFGTDNGDYVIISVEDLKALMASKPTIIKWSADGEINTDYLTEAAIYEYTTIGGKDAILFDAKLRSIWRSAFENSTISTVEVPNEIFTIGISAFKNSTISNITLSKNLRTIDGQAFYNCTSLSNITLPFTLRTIGEQAFENCTALLNVTMEDNCSSVGRQAFYKCTSLQNITFGSGTTLILGGCINGCTALKTITCKAITPPELYGGNYLTNVEAVYVPAGSVEVYKSASQWSSYANIIQAIQ